LTGELYADIDDALVLQTLEVATRNYLWQVQYVTNYEDKPHLFPQGAGK
jgi:hypothetical protein